MAFYRCGSSKPTTLIDGEETEEDIKLKSLGLLFKPVTKTLPTGNTVSTLNRIGVFADNNGFNSFVSYESGDTTYTYRYLWDKSSGAWVKQSDTGPNSMNLLSNFIRIGNYTYFLANTSSDTTTILYRYTNGTYTALYTASTLYSTNVHTLLQSETDSNIIYILGRVASSSDGYYYKMFKYNISANTLTEVKKYIQYCSSQPYAIYYKGAIHVIGYVSSTYKHYIYTDSAGFQDTGISVPYQPWNTGSLFTDDNYLYLESRNGGGFGIYRFDGETWTLIDNMNVFESNFFTFKHQNELYALRAFSSSDPNVKHYDEGRIYKIITNALEIV